MTQGFRESADELHLVSTKDTAGLGMGLVDSLKCDCNMGVCEGGGSMWNIHISLSVGVRD